jgi:prepilin-type processing-associated H-X9-DG protein
LLPALSAARERGRQASCISNLKQYGFAYQMYAGDWNDFLPMWRRNTYPNYVSFQNCLASYMGVRNALEGGANQNVVYYNAATVTPWFRCPSSISRKANSGSRVGNCYNQNNRWSFLASSPSNPYARLSNFVKPSQAILVYDRWQLQLDGLPRPLSEVVAPNTHRAGRSVLYVDGHVAILTEANDVAVGSNGETDIDPTLLAVY